MKYTLSQYPEVYTYTQSKMIWAWLNLSSDNYFPVSDGLPAQTPNAFYISHFSRGVGV